MATFNDEKKQKFSANSGTTGTLPDVTNAYLEQLTSPTGLATEEDKWKLQLNNLGYSGYDWQTNLFNYLGDIGYTGAWNDRFRAWLIDGGSFGPTVLIQLNSGGSCDYIDPDTTCLASGTYEANDFGFTNPANSWVWSIVSGAAAIQGSTTEKTVVVTTNDVGADVDFVLKVIATDTVSTDSAERQSALTQDHTNATEAPVFIGPNVNDVQFTKGQPISSFDTTILFTGNPLTFSVVGTLPAGLDYTNGILTGTPTTDQVESLQFRASNSKGDADSNSFTMTIVTVGQTLDVSELVAGSCTWIPPDTTCIASGQYVATPTGYSPDTWVWSVTTGTATIVAGQGTDTVTVETDSAADAIFTLKCVASIAATTAQDLTQFTQTHAEGASGPAFYALTPDPVTYEMKGVREGTGDLTTTHTASVYAPDFEGVYREFGANEPVWSGGRVVRNQVAYSGDFDNAGWNPIPNNDGFATKNGDGTITCGVTTGVGSRACVQCTLPIPLIAGNKYIIRVKITAISGNFNGGNFGSATDGASQFTLPDGSTPATYSYAFTATSESTLFRVGTGISQNDSSGPNSITIENIQIEDAAGRTDVINPSEYVETLASAVTKTYANLNGNTVTNNVVSEAVGAPLAEIPYLQYYPAAENELLHSRDFANATNWTPTGCTAVADAVGLDGAPNTGVTVTGTGNTSDKINPSSIAGTIQSTGVLYYRKTGTDATHVLFQPHQSQWVEFNPQDGTEIHTQGIASWDWIDQGDVVKVVVEANGGVDSIYNVYPNRSGGAASIVLLQMERHLSKSLAESRGLGPVFTTTAPSATDATVYVHDSANSANTPSAWYAEITSDGAQDIIDGFLSVTGTNWQLSDGTTTVTRPWTAGTEHQVGIAYGDGQMSIKVDATWSADVAYDGTMLQGILDLFRAGAFGGKMRELQRHDAANYAAAQAIINGLTP